MPAPQAPRRPHVHRAHDHEREDAYQWLRERDDPAVRAHLEAENAWCEAQLAPLAELRESLYGEIVARIRDQDRSVPVLDEGWWWYHRFEPGHEHPLHCRRRDPDGEEEVYLDVNQVADGADAASVAGLAISRDGRWLAYQVDLTGDREYELRIRDLATGEDAAERIPGCPGDGACWATDGEHLFYTRVDPETLRCHQVWRHRRGTGPADDVLVYQEDDETYDLGAWLTTSREWVVVSASATLSHEHRLIPADDPLASPRVFLPREREHEHSIDHLDGRFVIITNWRAENYRLMACGEGDTAKASWRELLPGRDHVLLEDVCLFRRHLVVEERVDGVPRLRLLDRDGRALREVACDEPVRMIYAGHNPDPDSPVLRFGYQSPTTPPTVYEELLAGGGRRLLKRYDPEGPFDPTAYACERLYATAADGSRVPISLVYRRDLRGTGPRPLELNAYGAYGMSMDPGFDQARLSLLDRGVVCAIAHVRGGMELGRRWYDQGRMEHKPNSFGDAIACAEALIASGWTAPDRLAISGGSAGGLLVAAVLNQRPELFRAAVLDVPFVDIVSTMLDASLPLTTGEYDEWGDPGEEDWYRTMLAYSPYDNLSAQPYPAMLVTTGFNDTNVQYWEPAKYVAKLRTLRTDDRPLLLHCDLDVGHGGKSGRYQRHVDTAREYAFLLWQLGLVDGVS